MSGEVAREALWYLESHHVMTLATNGTEGPWATAVFYVNDGFSLFFLSERHTRHVRNLILNPQVSVAIHEDYQDWRKIKGIQLAGEAHPVSNMLKADVLRDFAQKYSSLGSFIAHPTYMAIIARSFVYQIRPCEIWYLSNAKGFSHRNKIDIP